MRGSIQLQRWLRRYLPAEVSGILGALCCAWLASLWTDETGLIALAGTWGENVSYLTVMFARDRIRRDRPSTLHVVRELALEIGPAAVLDSVIVRPLLIYAGLRLAPTPAAGVAAGSILANCAFYVPAIATHERLIRRQARTEKGYLR